MSAPIVYPFTAAGIGDALTALGTTPGVVAANLLTMGFTGCRDKVARCPLANYLRASIADAVRAYATEHTCSVGRDVTSDGSSSRYVAADTSPAVRAFIGLFDGGRFPALNEEPSHA